MGEIATYFTAYPALFAGAVFILGLAVGSFLNVVIYRLPVMMERAWKQHCQELVGETGAPADSEPFNLARPASRCPHCGHSIGPLENIPLFSYLFQKGRCRHCQGPISARYPAVELTTAILSAVTAWHFGFGWQAGFALLLTWGLVALTFIDLDHQLLPDDITLPLLWLGLLLSLAGVFVPPTTAIIGAAAGYLSLWSVYQLFRLATGKEGMGYGDFKLLGLLGAWLGWQSLPVIIILSSVVGAAVGIGLILFRGHERGTPIPFGPYLAAAGWLALLWGEDLTRAYLRFAI
ncbi:prepilin peptidase [Thiohalomonas denitrificans]|uniref:Prepilin leader peptidase/N-methyltransferase n=1 Tax=Thiohalomonas denitrificans TaxID=415747 RepID=A0A1G5PLL3_9GAMM|nr:A24 family peptidase [Thiohalomonas denitrificans]SCZ50362.1 leader peptidase (prepilin peptidase) / N-methyltransferase [Thiohalomonas denitrificans]